MDKTFCNECAQKNSGKRSVRRYSLKNGDVRKVRVVNIIPGGKTEPKRAY